MAHSLTHSNLLHLSITNSSSSFYPSFKAKVSVQNKNAILIIWQTAQRTHKTDQEKNENKI